MKMTNYIKISMLFLPLLLVLIACSDDDNTNDFRIVRTVIDEKPISVVGTIELSSADFTFEVRKNDWCTVTKEDKILHIQAGANYDFMNRSTEIIINSGTVEYRVPVTQTGVLFEFASGEEQLNYKFSYDGGNIDLRILANVDFTYSNTSDDTDWISIKENENGEFTLTIDQSTVRRTGEVIFTYYEKELKVKIFQYKYLSISEYLGNARLSYDNEDGDRKTVDVTITKNTADQVLNIDGTFEGSTYSIPVSYMSDLEGILHFKGAIMNASFEDPDNHASIKALACIVYADQYMSGKPSGYAFGYVGRAQYYPSKADYEDDKTILTFYHSSEGFPDSLPLYTRKTRGIMITGTNKIGSTRYGTPYLKLDNIVLEVLQ